MKVTNSQTQWDKFKACLNLNGNKSPRNKTCHHKSDSRPDERGWCELSGETNGTLRVWRKKVGHRHCPPPVPVAVIIWYLRINNFWGRHAALPSADWWMPVCSRDPVSGDHPHGYLHHVSAQVLGAAVSGKLQMETGRRECVCERGPTPSPWSTPSISLMYTRVTAWALWCVLCWGTCTEAHKYVMLWVFLHGTWRGTAFHRENQEALGNWG